jgi:3-methylfumaryl-CoA hydratase
VMPDDSVKEAEDRCVLPLVRRLAALLDADPQRWREGDRLPRGWHVMLFNPDTPQADLRADGTAGLGVTLPDLGLPRLMMGGRRIRYEGDIAIGVRVHRRSRLANVTPKSGRSGRFAIVTIRHEVTVQGDARPVLVEEQDYIMREAAPSGGSGTAEPAPTATTPPAPAAAPDTVKRTVTPDETMLFRYSSITSNPHRIHYDHPYATAREGYPALVVNGGLPTLWLSELFKREAGREPIAVTARNVAPLFCRRPVALHAQAGAPWRLWAADDTGRLAIEAQIE